jgi:hypothetical protein
MTYISWEKTPKALIVRYKQSNGMVHSYNYWGLSNNEIQNATLSYVRIKTYHKTYAKSPFATRRTGYTKYQINSQTLQKSAESKLNLGMSLSQAFRPVKSHFDPVFFQNQLNPEAVNRTPIGGGRPQVKRKL